MQHNKLLTSFSGKSIFLLMLVSSFVFQSCGQHGLKSTHAFYQQTFTGTVAVDDNGNPITRGTDTLRFLYVASEQLPFIDTVIFFGKTYLAIIEDKGYKTQDLGQKKQSIEKVSLNSNGVRRLWRIDLTPLNIERPEAADKVLLFGRLGSKDFSLEVKNIIELEPELRQ